MSGGSNSNIAAKSKAKRCTCLKLRPNLVLEVFVKLLEEIFVIVLVLVEIFVTHDALLLLVEIFVKGNPASELLLDRQPLQKVPSAVTPSVHFSPTW